MGENGFLEGLLIGRDGNNSNNMGFGGGWVWIIFLFFLLCWGGWGRGFGGGYGGGAADTPSFQGLATRADINEGFALNGLTNGISGLRDGQFGIQQTLCQGFNGTNAAINQLGFQMSECCCQTQRAIDGANYNMAKNTCDITHTISDLGYNMTAGFNNIIQNTHNDTDRIIAQLNQMEANRQAEKIQQLQSENQTLRFQASQTAQNGFIDAVGNSIVARLQPASPVPAYVVPNSNCCSPICNTGYCA